MNGTAAGTVVTNNNGILGGWSVIDNGNSTYSWANAAGGGPYTITAGTTTASTTPATTDNGR